MPFLLSLSSSDSSGSSDWASRSERKAIDFPSGDHCGSESCPDWVSGTIAPSLSRHSQRSSRKRCAFQSAREVAMTTIWPSGESSTRLKSTALKNSSSVRRGLEPDEPAASAGVTAVIRNMESIAIAVREKCDRRKPLRRIVIVSSEIRIIEKAGNCSADYKQREEATPSGAARLEPCHFNIYLQAPRPCRYAPGSASCLV